MPDHSGIGDAAANRTVLLVAQPTVAGVAQCVYDWAVGLGECGWRAVVACPTDGWLLDRCHDSGIRTYPWESVHTPHAAVPSELARLRQIIQRAAPDVVHLNGVKAGLVGRLALRGHIGTAFSPHSWAFEAAEGPRSSAALQWERFATRWTDVILSVSEAEAELGLARGIDATYVIARNGIDTDAITPPPNRAEVRRQLGIPDGVRAVVCVGRLHRQKGQDVLLAAWPRAAAPGRRLYLVGDGPMAAKWEAANQRDDVIFTGPADRPTAVAWMQAADVVVVPSRWEGMALVPLESLAAGTPVIASDVTGVSEAVGPGCGAVVPPGDPVALAEAIGTWLAREPAALADARTAAQDWVTSQFNIVTTVRTISETLLAVSRRAEPSR